MRIVRHVGNYGELFDRNVGPGSPLGISRGLNGCGPRAACNTRRRSGELATLDGCPSLAGASGLMSGA